jgi:hypothetical protein
MLDAELDSVMEADAPGATAYRSQLKAMLQGKEVKMKSHESIIRELDEGADVFNIQLLAVSVQLLTG